LGSGVIVRSDGIIITNNHVVDQADEVKVSLSDRRELTAKVLLADPRVDLAVLKIEATNLPTLALNDTGDTQIGDLVLAIGDPFGVGQTVTNGIVSALNRSDPSSNGGVSYIQTDAAINPGNSGGALVDMNGDLLGVNSFILSQSGTSSGVGFAIPAALVRRAVETAVGGGKVLAQPWLGAKLSAVTSEAAQALGMSGPRGLLVGKVWPGSAADRAGLKADDIVTAVGGQAVNDPSGVNYALGSRRIGDRVPLAVTRGGRSLPPLNLPVELAPDSPARSERTLGGDSALAGLKVANFNPAVALELEVDPFTSPGVVIEALGQDGGGTLRPGDFIRAVNTRPVANVADLVAAVAAQAGRVFTITVERNGQQETFRVR
ncbi:MAG: serine protease, partial [Caulobacteraceae bacterium]|nr:serine protease [Caulobacteraceae bacterium]